MKAALTPAAAYTDRDHKILGSMLLSDVLPNLVPIS